MRLYAWPPFILQVLAYVPVRIFLKICVRFRVHGTHNLKIHKQVILTPNHVSELDAVLVTAGVPLTSGMFPFFYTCLPKEHYKNKKFGWRRFFYGGLFFRAWGAYPLRVGTRDYETAVAEHRALMSSGYSILMFPEGKMSSDGTMGEARGGAVFLSERTGAPLVPVRVRGHASMSLADMLLRRRRVDVFFGKPIFAEDVVDGDRDDKYKSAARTVITTILSLEENFS